MRLSAQQANDLREIFQAYLNAHHVTEADLWDVTVWAQTHRGYHLPDAEITATLRDRMATALRQTKRESASGIRHRVFHSYNAPTANGHDDDEGEDEGEQQQQTLWGHIDTMSHEAMIQAFDQRWVIQRQGVTALRRDLTVYNERRFHDGLQPLQMSFNFDLPAQDDGDDDDDDN